MHARTHLTEPERLAVAARVAARIGAPFVAADVLRGTARLPCVRHAPTGTLFAVVPGGSFRMGFTRADESATRERLDPHDDEDASTLVELTQTCRPTRRVRVAPFLCAVRPLLHSDAAALLGSYRDRASPFWAFGPLDPALPVVLAPTEAAAVLAQTGFRLLSEAEWEYVARAGGSEPWINGDPEAACEALVRVPYDDATGAPATNDFGVWGLPLGEWVADAWHPSYVGAPRDARAWEPKVAPQLGRGTGGRNYPWQTQSEVALCHAAYRERQGNDAMLDVRFAMDLPRELTAG